MFEKLMTLLNRSSNKDPFFRNFSPKYWWKLFLNETKEFEEEFFKEKINKDKLEKEIWDVFWNLMCFINKYNEKS